LLREGQIKKNKGLKKNIYIIKMDDNLKVVAEHSLLTFYFSNKNSSIPIDFKNSILTQFFFLNLKEEREFMNYDSGNGERKYQVIPNLTTKKVKLGVK